MQPGDLVFYGGHDNGRYLGIYHVAIYIGNGEVVEALNEQHGIVYGTLRTKNVILVLRPKMNYLDTDTDHIRTAEIW